MKYRALGSTGLDVSEIGFGAWGIGKSQWLGGEDAESSYCREKGIGVIARVPFDEGSLTGKIGRILLSPRATSETNTSAEIENSKSGIACSRSWPRSSSG